MVGCDDVMFVLIDYDLCKDLVVCCDVFVEVDVVIFCFFDVVVIEVVVMVGDMCIIDVFIVYCVNDMWVYGMFELFG